MLIKDYNLNLEKAISLLELQILISDSDSFIINNIATTKDIYKYRFELKRMSGSNQTISHIANIICERINKKKRMRSLDCLKVLRSLVKQCPEKEIKQNTIEALFNIYKFFIFSSNEEVQWCVSAILKGKVLSDNSIDWILDNANKSEHLINRILLYPERHQKITSWIRINKNNVFLKGRESEIIAILINSENAENLYKLYEINTFLWGIYKSHLTRNKKILLIQKYSNLTSIYSTIEIAERLVEPAIINNLLQKLQRSQQVVSRDARSSRP